MACFEDLLPIDAVNRGRDPRREQDRSIINGILWRLRCGTPWRDVPAQMWELEHDLPAVPTLERGRGLRGALGHACRDHGRRPLQNRQHPGSRPDRKSDVEGKSV